MTITTAERSNVTLPTVDKTRSVISKDGTMIGYYQRGQGNGVVLVQGTMGTAQHFTQLATALADSFTVYVPDRRGRGLSGSGVGEYSVQKEVEDLDALLTHTGAHAVFGLSSGAIITLEAALTLPAIHKAAIFEPPLYINGLPTALIARYENEAKQGKTAASLVTAMLAAQMGPSIFNWIPHRLLELLVNMGIKSEDKRGSGDYPSMRELAPTLQNDFKIVTEKSEAWMRFKDITSEVLLMGGSQSPAYLKTALESLNSILPQAARVEFPSVGHAAPWNSDKRGQPEIVAAELRRFFTAT